MIRMGSNVPEMEKFRKPPQVFIGTPLAGGVCEAEYLECFPKTCTALANAGIPVMAGRLTSESSVERARNVIANQFLLTSCTHLLFIDADMHWEAADVLRMVSHNVPMVAGAGPTKSFEPEGLKRYCCNLHPSFNGHQSKPLVEALQVGTGLMLIAREVFDEMIARGNVPSYDCGDIMNPSREYKFFERRIESDGYGRQLDYSEDYAFCNRWRAMGGTVWVDTLCRIGHVGRHVFRNETMHEFLTNEAMNEA